MERWHVKILATLITIVVMLLAVFVPFKIVAKFKKLDRGGNKILDTLGCFTGGIFLGTSLFFLLPEVISLMEQHGDSVTNFPVAEGVIAIGFVFVMFLERMVHSCRRKKKTKSPRDGHCCEEKYEKVIYVETSHLKKDKNGSTEFSHEHYGENKLCVPIDITLEAKETIAMASMTDEGEDQILVTENATKAVILFIALSLDEFLGGISMGLQRTSTAVWGILVGLLAHESVVGFSFGLQLASLSKSKPGCFAVALALSYALIGPIGAIVGTLIGELSWSSSEQIDSVNGVLQGLATGVFLYVTFFEILSGKINSRSRYIDLIAVTIGITIMALMSIIPKEEVHIDNDNITLSTMASTVENFTR